MKFKKILSSVVAAAMAVTTFSAFSTTATAEETTTVIWTGSTALTSDWSVNQQISSTYFSYWEGDVTVTVEYEYQADASYAMIGLNYYDPAWTWTSLKDNVSVTNSSTEIEFTLTEEEMATVAAGQGFVVGGTGATLTSVSLAGNYNPPSTDVWKNNGDGTYTFVKGSESGGAPDLTIPVDNKSNVLAISMDVTVEGGANGTLGANIGGTWTKANGDDAAWENTSTINWTLEGELSSDPLFQTWWANAGTKITISNIQFIEANKVYTQKSAVVNGVYSIRGVKLISEETAAEADSVRFFFYNGKTAAIDSTKCYHTIKAGGATITAPEGYVFVALCVGNIPEGKTVTCSGIDLYKDNVKL